MDKSVIEDITGDWLRIARVWGFGDLEQLAVNAHESAKEALFRAEARADLARETANAPAKRRDEKIAELTPEQDAKLARLILRSDALVTARTVLEDAPNDLVLEDVKRRTLGILVIEAGRATEEAHAYQQELGIRPW